jgi:hypothetical protein
LEETTMALKIGDKHEGNQVEVTVKGKLAKEDYDLFVPAFEAAVAAAGKLRLLFIMDDFHGWEAGALWADIKFDLKHFKDIERLAMVGDRKWEKGMSVFCKPFTTAKIRYFDKSRINDARAWLRGD